MREARKRLRVKTQRLVESPAMLRSMLATRKKLFCGCCCAVLADICAALPTTSARLEIHLS